MHTRRDDLLVGAGHALQRLLRVTCNDLDDARQRVFAVAGVDALGRVADEEVALPLQSGLALEQRYADFLGRTRVHGRLVNDRRTLLHVATDRDAGADERREVGLVRRVDRRRHRHDDEVGLAQPARIGGRLEQRRRGQV